MLSLVMEIMLLFLFYVCYVCEFLSKPSIIQIFLEREKHDTSVVCRRFIWLFQLPIGMLVGVNILENVWKHVHLLMS